MSKKLANYSPESVIILVAGLHTVTGYAEGSFISIEKVTPTSSARESADGVVSRVIRNSSLYNVRLTLAQSSDSNGVLSIFHNVDRLTNGRAKFPFIMKDKRGSSVMFAAEAWISSVPESTFSSGVEGRTWEIVCAGATNNVGGNYDESSIVEDVLGVGAGLLGGVL